MITTVRALFVSVTAIGLLAVGQAAQAQDKSIKIGALFPMSGPGSYFGAQDKLGVELALEQLNARRASTATNFQRSVRRSWKLWATPRDPGSQNA